MENTDIMMEQQCIDSIINVISKSNMADLDFLNTEIRPITCEIDEDGKEKHIVQQSRIVRSVGRWKSSSFLCV